MTRHKFTALAFAAMAAMSAQPILATAIPSNFAANVEAMIRTEPAQGLYNKPWYNYQSDILEAKKELRSDLKRATDREDRIDAWGEYEHEVIDADKDYVKAMRKRGVLVGRVIVG